MMDEGWLQRIRQSNPRVADVLSCLQTISPDDRDSILLHVFEGYRGNISPHDIFERYKRSRFLRPCGVSQRDLLALEALIYDIVPQGWEALELSPVAPLGVNSNLACVDQKNILSAIRRMEVQADVTMGLMLECAVRRGQLLKDAPQNATKVNLCSHLRCLRLQFFTEDSGFTPHFKVFGMCSAGRDEGGERFEMEVIVQHIETYLKLLSLSAQIGYQLTSPVIAVSHMALTEKFLEQVGLREKVRSLTQSDVDIFFESGVPQKKIIERLDELSPALHSSADISREVAYLEQIDSKIVMPLRKRHPRISFVYDIGRVAGIGYYPSLTFKLTAETSHGQKMPLADGGLVRWTQKLLANRKERLFISGFGTELFYRMFRNDS